MNRSVRPSEDISSAHKSQSCLISYPHHTQGNRELQLLYCDMQCEVWENERKRLHQMEPDPAAGGKIASLQESSPPSKNMNRKSILRAMRAMSTRSQKVFASSGDDDTYTNNIKDLAVLRPFFTNIIIQPNIMVGNYLFGSQWPVVMNSSLMTTLSIVFRIVFVVVVVVTSLALANFIPRSYLVLCFAGYPLLIFRLLTFNRSLLYLTLWNYKAVVSIISSVGFTISGCMLTLLTDNDNYTKFLMMHTFIFIVILNFIVIFHDAVPKHMRHTSIKTSFALGFVLVVFLQFALHYNWIFPQSTNQDIDFFWSSHTTLVGLASSCLNNVFFIVGNCLLIIFRDLSTLIVTQSRLEVVKIESREQAKILALQDRVS